MKNLLNQAEKILSEESLKFNMYEKSDIIELKMDLDSGVFTILILCNEESEYCSVRCILPNKVSAAKKISVSELFNRFNHQFAFGAFAMDMQDGEMYYQHSFMTINNQIEKKVFMQTLKLAINMANDQYNKIMSVIFGNVQPVLATLEMAN